MLYNKAIGFCRETGIFSLLEKSSAVIVGFSGGADSTVLLSFFLSIREKFPHLQIIAAHVNHMIRAEEAERDEEFCRSFCKVNEIPFESARINIPKLCKNYNKGTEETARIERYSFFESLCEKYPSALIATAHNADDNLETVIFHVARGSGTKGLSGISPIREGKLIRPLLSCTSEEIRSFANAEGIEYVTDSTNLDTLYTRNAIRHSVLPLLYGMNPKASDAALRLSSAARLDCDFIEKEAKKLLSSPLTRKKLADLHPALFQRVLLALFKKKAGTSLDLSEKNVSDCRALVSGKKSGSISLPCELAFFADKNEVYVAKDRKYLNDAEKAADIPLPLLKDTPLCFGDFCIMLSENKNYVNIIDENVYKLSLHESLDCDRISGNTWIRARRPGDVIQKGRMTKKLKKLLCDNDVPLRLRDHLPLITDDDGIVYVPFVGARDGVLSGESTKKIIYLGIFEKKG